MKIKKNIAISESGFVFDANSGDSYSLNNTGKDILSLLQENKNEDEIKEYIIQKYDVDASTLENNYYDFINMLSNLNLIENQVK